MMPLGAPSILKYGSLVRPLYTATRPNSCTARALRLRLPLRARESPTLVGTSPQGMAEGVAPLQRPHLVAGVVGKATQGLTGLPSPISTTTKTPSKMKVLTWRMSKMIPCRRPGRMKRDTFIT